jgi:hypothetical protein
VKKLILILLLFPSILSAQTPHPQLDRERILNALLKTEFGSNIYYDDGAGDGTLIRYKQDAASNYTIEPDSTVRTIVDAGANALPLLISCISDTRPTRIKFQPASNSVAAKRGVTSTQVPLGYVCLDLLTAIADDPKHKTSDPDDGYDGICADAREGYCFRPDVLAATSGHALMAKVQANWKRLLERKLIHYRYPQEWKVACKTCSPPK